MSKNRVIELVIVVFVLITGGFVGMKLWQAHQAAEDIKNGPSNQEVLNVITRDKPSFLFNHRPIIEVASIKRLQDTWYIVTIRSVNDDTVAVPVRIVLHDQRTSSGPRDLKTILGPEAHFTDYQLLRSSLPDSVRQELQKS